MLRTSFASGAQLCYNEGIPSGRRCIAWERRQAMKRIDPSEGFIKCFVANLLIHAGWGILSLVLLVLHFVLDWPWWLMYLSSVIWGVESLVLTALVCWGNRTGNASKKEKENKNPYSVKAQDASKEDPDIKK